MSNFVDNANATALMGAVEESIANTRIFPGTLDEYDALTPGEKAKYKYIATPDQEVVTKNNLEAEIADIVNVYGAKNLIPYPYHETTISKNGITFTDNGDGTVTANGTATANTSFNLNYPTVIETLIKLDKNKTYVVSDTTKVGTSNSIVVGCRYYAEGMTPSTSSGTNVACTENNNWQVTITNAVYAYVYIYVRSGVTVSNVTFKPMIRLASIQDDTYVPYVPTNKELLSCKLNGYVGAKNLLPYPYRHTTRTAVGITYTDNGDGTITANGTATADAAFELNNLWSYNDNFNMNGKTYMLTGVPNGSSSTTYFVQGLLKNGTDSQDAYKVYDNSDGNVVAPRSANDHVGFRIIIKSGQTVSNLVFKPMLRYIEDTDPTWVPYAKTNKELTDNLKVKTIELTNQTTSSDGKLILTGMGHKMAIVSSRLLDDSNNHLIVPFGFCYSSNGDALFMLADNSDNTIITSSITLSGTMEYIDLS